MAVLGVAGWLLDCAGAGQTPELALSGHCLGLSDLLMVIILQSGLHLHHQIVYFCHLPAVTGWDC